MTKRLTVLTLALLLTLPALASARDMTGLWGPGYFNTDAPVGARFWFTPTIGIDVGIGFEATEGFWVDPDVPGADAEKTTFTSFWFEAGLPIVVYPSDRANFFIRPGVEVGMLDDRAYGTGDFDARWTVVTASVTLAGEVFFGDRFSLEAGHGLAAQFTSQPDEIGGESFTDFYTFDASIAYLGFHFYFGSPAP